MGKIWRRILIGIVILAAIIGIVAKLLEPKNTPIQNLVKIQNVQSRREYWMKQAK